MLSLSFLLPAVLAGCPSVACKPSAMEFAPSTCIYANSTAVYLAVCQSADYCPPVTAGNSTCAAPQPPAPGKAWPGEPCSSNATCITGVCINSTCIGSHWLQPCTDTSQCHVGLFCNNATVCWPLRKQYGPCSSDYDCQNNMACMKWDNNQQGQCIEMYSLPQQEWVYDCENRLSKFCLSGNCGGPGGKGVCIDGIKPRYLDNECTEDSQCVGESFGWQFYSKCQCGYNAQGTGYCKPFLGDYLGKQYLSALKEWLASEEIQNCHTERRMSEVCMAGWSGYKDYLKKMYLWQDFPLLQNNDACVKEIYTNYYWGIN
jgi:hypothetical protein